MSSPETTPLPEGLRNNNPTNLRANGDKWRGLLGEDAKGFCRFDTPLNGLRAGGINSLNGQRLHGRETVEALVSAWAPPNENDTQAYISDMLVHMGMLPGERIDLDSEGTLAKWLAGLVMHENGMMPYSGELLAQAAEEALDD